MEKLPYINAALLCERIIQEKEGTLSAIRIIDRLEFGLLTNNPELEKLNVRPAVPISALIAIKSGPVTGKFNLNIDGVKPSGKTKHLLTLPFELKGEHEGQNFIVNIMQGTEEEGLHWFEIRLDETLLTKIPLMLVRKIEPEKTGAQTIDPQNRE